MRIFPLRIKQLTWALTVYSTNMFISSIMTDYFSVYDIIGLKVTWILYMWLMLWMAHEVCAIIQDPCVKLNLSLVRDTLLTPHFVVFQYPTMNRRNLFFCSVVFLLYWFNLWFNWSVMYVICCFCLPSNSKLKRLKICHWKRKLLVLVKVSQV